LPLERDRHHGEVPVAEALIDRLLPFVSQARKGGEAVVAGRLQGEAHVLERERQRELGLRSRPWRSVAAWPLPSRHERAAGKGVHDLLGVKPQSVS
jgi:hypothetical protein